MASLAQGQPTVSKSFVRYLMAKRFFDEAILETERLRKQFPADDSLSFLLGLAHYEQQQLAASVEAWNNISPGSNLFIPTQFFKGYAQLFSARVAAGLTTIQSFSPSDSVTHALRAVQVAGAQLLLRDFKAFEAATADFGRIPMLRKHEQNLIAYGTLLQKRNRKPWKAGLLQTIVPGAGYFYAGYKGHAIYNLLVSTLLGLQALEGYRKSGPESGRFIAYASAFALVHVASIWGSTLAVKIRREEREKTIDDQILVDLHIPLRTVFR
jgi:hypothetical protein